MADPAQSMPTRIGPYKIDRVLGVGGMGTVYHALHVNLQREVALKVLNPSSARNELVLRRFRDEARAAAMPFHENIVIMYENGEDQGYHYLALEYVKGVDLLHLIEQKGRLPVGFSAQIVKQAAKALQHAHQHGFVHRDIKPSNFLLTREHVVKLTDMGLARHLEDIEEDGVTRHGTTVGTVDYIAPEQARKSRDADIRSDIYSLGCTWFHMLSGDVPYPGGTAMDRLYKHVSEAVPEIRKVNPRVPEEISAVIRRMMAKDPKDRYQTPAELVVAIDAALGGKRSLDDSDPDGNLDKTIAAQPALSEEAAPKRENRVMLFGMWGLVLGLVIASGLWLFLSPSSTRSPVADGDPLVLAPSAPDPAAKAETKDDASAAPVAKPADPPTDAKKESKTKSDAGAPKNPVDAKATSTEKPAAIDPNKTGRMDLAALAKLAGRNPDAPASGPEPGPTLAAKAKNEEEGFFRGINDTEEGRRNLAALKKLSMGPGPDKADPNGQAAPPPPPVTRLPAMKLPTDVVTRNLPVRLPFTPPEAEVRNVSWQNPPEVLKRPEKAFLITRMAESSDEESSSAALRSGASGVKQAWNASVVELAGSPGTPAWFEYRLDGPIFNGSHTFNDRPVVMRAADGHLPLVVYQDLRSPAETTDAVWFHFKENNRVEVEGLHFVLYASDIPNKSRNEEFDLFRVDGADVTFRRCTFTVLGQPLKRICIARSRSSAKGGDGAPTRIRFQDCVVRGDEINVLSVETANVDVLVENSCFVARTGSVFWFDRPDRVSPTYRRTLRVAESSLMSGNDLIRWKIEQDRPSKLEVLSRDSAWLPTSANSRRPLMHIDLLQGAALDADALQWKSYRTLFGAWATLAIVYPAGRPGQTLIADGAAWRARWTASADQEQFSTELGLAPLDEDFPFSPYPIVPAEPVSFSGGRSIQVGYNPAKCLPLTPFWFQSAYGNFDTLPKMLELPLRDDPAKRGVATAEITLPKDNLLEVLAKNRTASRIEVRVKGEGRVQLPSVRLEKQSLVLRFDPISPAAAKPLIIEPKGKRDALFTINGGSLLVENGRFQWPSDKAAPERFALVRGGELNLNGCQIETPTSSKNNAVTELIRFERGPNRRADEWSRLLLNNTFLASAAPLVALEAPMTAGLINNCVFVTQSDAFQIYFGDKPPEKWFAGLDVFKCTFNAARSAFRIYPFPSAGAAPAYPFVISAQDNLFTDLMDAKGGRDAGARVGAVVSFESDILSRGLVVWQGAHNAYDKRLSRYLAVKGRESEKLNSKNAWLDWLRVWGRRHEANPMIASLEFEGKSRSADRAKLDGLVLAPGEAARLAASDAKQVGADLAPFGVVVAPPTRTTPAKIEDHQAALPLRKTLFTEPRTKPPVDPLGKAAAKKS